jgi:hypothetical protein
MEIAMFGGSSWMPCAPQGVKGLDNDNDDYYYYYYYYYETPKN